jgi:hypothetical protein
MHPIFDDPEKRSRGVGVLPFVSMPDYISIVRLKTALRFKASGVDLKNVGVFIHSGDEIWSFTPLPVLTAALEAITDKDHCEYRSRHSLEAGSSGCKILSWLLRKHFERYLWRFSGQGLFVEGDPMSPRAFFHGENASVRNISYTADAHQATRKVVVQCAGGKRPWFRNEGFGYQALPFENFWGVAMEPFFLFTGPDASKPLPYAAQNVHSKHHSTKTGQSHLSFWIDFLSSGAALIDLRDRYVDTLFLGRALVPEQT